MASDSDWTEVVNKKLSNDNVWDEDDDPDLDDDPTTAPHHDGEDSVNVYKMADDDEMLTNPTDCKRTDWHSDVNDADGRTAG